MDHGWGGIIAAYQISRSSRRVDVGTPPGDERWELREVCFHGFIDLPSTDAAHSPWFKCLGYDWFLGISLDGLVSSSAGMAAVCLYSMSDDTIDVEYYLSVRNSARKEVARFDDTMTNGRGGNRNFSKRSTMFGALVEGTLTVEVGMRKRVSQKVLPTPFVPENPLSKNILKNFMDAESADVVFEVGGEVERRGGSRKKAKIAATVLHAHRFILKDSASAFAELCKSGGGGVITIPITGVKAGILRLMLYYFYGGKLSDEDLKENARDLIDATDKYGVVSLKLTAEACYVESTTLTLGNVLDNLLYAHSKNCALLKEAVMDFILENGEAIMDNVSFENVPSAVVTDLLAAVARGKKEDGGGEDSHYHSMRVGKLRQMLDEKGLHVDGSREAMIALLKEKS